MTMSFSAYRRDALRYRALESTEKAAPWENVLGGHKKLAGLADALVTIIKQEQRQGQGLDIQLEDAPTMSVGGGEGLAGVTGQPPVSKLAQRKWIKRNNIVRRH